MSFKSRDLTVKLSGTGGGGCGGCTATRPDCGACTPTHPDGGGCAHNTKQCGPNSAINCSATGPTTGPGNYAEGMEVSGGLLAQLRQQLLTTLAAPR